MTSQAKTPTTFIQADTATFRHLVQQLTGLSGDNSKPPPVSLHPKLSPKTSNRHSPFKLQDRRRALPKKLEISLGLSDPDQQLPPYKTHCDLSPGLGPVTPPGSESTIFSEMSLESPAASQEERAIAEKGFYLHSSPATTPRRAEPPELLPLFPVTSPEQERLRHG